MSEERMYEKKTSERDGERERDWQQGKDEIIATTSAHSSVWSGFVMKRNDEEEKKNSRQ